LAPLDFAVLAPVPREHLDDGQDVARRTGYVCFGSHKWELFRELDRRRDGERVPVLIYASHNEELAEWGYVVAWKGNYVGSVDDTMGKLEEERGGHRPRSTDKYRHKGDSATGWPVFWKVSDLTQLTDTERRELRDFQSYRTGRDKENSAPRGPEIIVRPMWV
jgi:hypothetical protein